MDEKFFTTEQVANILQVHPFTILKFIKQGRLKGIKLGRVYRIKESDIKNFLEQSRSAPAKGGPKKTEAPNQETKLKETEASTQETKPSKHYELNKKKKDDDNHYYII